MGFPGPVEDGLVKPLRAEFGARGEVAADESYMRSAPRLPQPSVFREVVRCWLKAGDGDGLGQRGTADHN